MTDTKTDAEGSRIIADGLAAVEALRAHTAAIDQARDSQPERLRAARAAADAAREQCLADPDEHWLTQVRAIPTYTADGELAGGSLDVPTLVAKGVFGTRLAFDVLAHAGDSDAVDAIMDRYFAMTRDPGSMFLLCAEALKTIAVDIAPQLLGLIEECGSDWNTRVALADTARVAWEARVAHLDDQSGGDQ
jgi:hypothetical protein